LTCDTARSSSEPPKKSTSLDCISASLANIRARVLSLNDSLVEMLLTGACCVCCCPFGAKPCVLMLCEKVLNPENIALAPSLNCPTT